MSAQIKIIERSEKIRPERSEKILPERSEKPEEALVLRGKVMAELARSSAKIEEPTKPAPAKEALVTDQSLPREMDAMVDKLNIAARDLVEAVDGALPRDLERAYANGERGVYTHRLFEGRGKRLQRLIVERYGSDRPVRGKVDSFIRLFERLLDRLSTVSQGGAMVEACLASESGRIYVMLAEAAGRIPPQ